MVTQQLALVGPAYEPRSPRLDAQRCLNLYPELGESPQPKDVAVLLGTPGHTARIQLPGQGGIRGMHRTTVGNRPFVVHADKLYELISPTTVVERGTLAGHSTRASMDNTGQELCVVADGRGWILNLATNGFTPITDVDFPPADTVVVMSEFFVVNRRGTNGIAHSVLFDGLTWRSDDFFSGEASADPTVGLLRSHNQLWVFGTESAQIFVLNPGGEPAFVALQSPFIEQGTANPFTMVELGEQPYWIGGNQHGFGTVWRGDGYSATRISHHGIETALNRTDQQSITAYGYHEEGHRFYVVQTLTHTWVYDVATGLWHERGKLNTQGLIEPQDPWLHMLAFGKHYVGSSSTGTLYETSLDTFTLGDDPLPRIRVLPYWHLQRQRITHQWIEFDMALGVGTSTGALEAVKPFFTVDWSNDHGATYGNKHLLSMGRQGETLIRARRRQLGRPYDRLYRWSSTAPVKTALLSAYLEVD